MVEPNYGDIAAAFVHDSKIELRNGIAIFCKMTATSTTRIEQILRSTILLESTSTYLGKSLQVDT